jgi:hypothetical protein
MVVSGFSGRFSRLAAVSGLMLTLIIPLAACMAPAAYVPRRPGATTGYTDRELAPGRFRVTFTGNSVTARETVENYLLLRAAEVTLAAGGTHFIFDDRDTRARTTLHADPAFYGHGTWGAGSWGFRPSWGYSAFGPPLMISQTTRYEAYAEIVVLKPGQEGSENRAVDARAIVSHLGPEAAPPPPDHA